MSRVDRSENFLSLMAGQWKTMGIGLLTLVPVAFAVDSLAGTTYLESGDFQWDVAEHLMALQSSVGVMPWLPLVLLALLVGFAIEGHVFLMSHVRGGDASETPCSCQASR
jgi:hypothetical protein